MYRLAHYLAPTTKEKPADAVIPSHVLMLRAGYVRQLGAGLYVHLPLMWRSVRKAEQIVREEQNRIGAQEMFMPGMTPAGLWEESGRWKAFGDDMFRVKDRKGGDYALAPTHEEVVADVARGYINSYKQLPQIWYQFQTKFRDEPRPRSGVIRSRQFIMKDAYSLDIDEAGLDKAYALEREAYIRAFTRCGVKFMIVGASSGLMGGSGSEEFMVVTPSGEDTIAFNEETGFAANVEVAQGKLPDDKRTPEVADKNNVPEKEAVPTPDVKTIEEVAAFFEADPTTILKTVLYMTNDPNDTETTPVMCVVRGDHQVNEEKLLGIVGKPVRPAHDAEVLKVCGCPAGFISPVGLEKEIPIYVDVDVTPHAAYIAGGNAADTHFKSVYPPRDFPKHAHKSIRMVADGDLTPDGSHVLQVDRAIELGHIFKLGTRYSDSMGATILDENGKARPIVMGSYGIGLERIVACAIEQHHDDTGVVLPLSIAPFAVVILALDPKNDQVMELANSLGTKLESQGWDVAIDDRKERPGVKFADADLIGIPFQVVIGSKGIEKGEIEVKRRRDMERMSFPKESAAQELSRLLMEEMGKFQV